LNRFGEVLFEDIGAAFQIGNGAGDLEDPVAGTGGEDETVGDQFEEAVTGGIQFAVFSYEAGGHLGVAMDFCPFESHTSNLYPTPYTE